MPATLILSLRSLDSSCQTGKMAALLNSLFFVFKISFLPKYRVIYYDCIVKWCSGIYCKWCVSLNSYEQIRVVKLFVRCKQTYSLIMDLCVD